MEIPVDVSVDFLPAVPGVGMNLWEKILTHLEAELNPQTSSTWFRPSVRRLSREIFWPCGSPNPVYQRGDEILVHLLDWDPDTVTFMDL